VNRRRFIALTVGAAGSLGVASRLFPTSLKRVEQKSFALGAEVSLTAYHEDQATAQSAVNAALKALDAIEDLLSLYRPQSEISRLNNDGLLKQPHKDLLAVAGTALAWARRTDGAFDPTVQPLWALYARGTVPSSAEIESARRLVSWRRVHSDATQIRLGQGQQITLNGIAQGFAADRVGEVLRSYGIRHALVNTGEFGALGRRSDGKPWQVGIQHPRVREAYAALAALSDRFLSTSGDYETKFSEDFSSNHIFDPATGRSPTELASVTVVAPTGIEADALSTAIFVLGPARGLELAASRSSVDALLVLKSGGVLMTPHFPRIA
jgi:thiamine biosynthesis lipoprotein